MAIKQKFLKSWFDIIYIALSFMQKWSSLLKENNCQRVLQVKERILHWMKTYIQELQRVLHPFVLFNSSGVVCYVLHRQSSPLLLTSFFLCLQSLCQAFAFVLPWNTGFPNDVSVSLLSKKLWLIPPFLKKSLGCPCIGDEVRHQTDGHNRKG